MNAIRNILLLNGVVFILLHAIVPHKHLFEMTDEEHALAHEKADDVFDFFGLWFHQDSNKVLDNYTLAGNEFIKKFDFNGFNGSAAQSFSKAESFFSGLSQYFKIQPQNLSNDFIIRSHGLRAPPDSDFYY